MISLNLQKYSRLIVRGLIAAYLLMSINACTILKIPEIKVFRSNKILQDSFLISAHVSYAFQDLESEKIFLEQNSNKCAIPASNMKIFTLYSALKVFGDSLPAGCIFNNRDSLIFIPSGNPGFLYKHLTYEKLWNRLKNSGRPLIFVALPKHDNQVFGTGWAWDDDGKIFQTGRHPLAMYGGQLSLKKEENSTVSIPGTFFDQSFVYQPGGSSTKEIILQKKPFENQIELNRKINKNDSFEKTFSFYPSNELLIDLFRDTLNKNIVISHYMPYRHEQVCFNQEANDIYITMMHDSDNFIAEQIMYMIGYEASQEFSVASGIEFSLENLIPNVSKDHLQWVDGSGLSRYNLTTVHSVINLLIDMIESYGIEKVKNFLPEGGKQGTISNYYWGDPGYVWAKTGQLSNHYNLSGLLKTKSGKDVIFSIMVNNHTCSRNQVIKSIEKAIQHVRDEY